MANAADRAYEKIGELILQGQYKPGDRLSEEELSKISGVSRTPVRDALRRLEAEYFVVIRPNQGAEVAVWSARDIEDLFNMRAMLEGMAASRAAERRSEEDIVTMQACVDGINLVINNRRKFDVDAFLTENKKFHRAMLAAARSPRLSAAISNLIAPAVITRTAQFFTRDDIERSNSHHQDLLEAIHLGDREVAESIMHTHIRTAARSYKKELEPS